MPTFAAVHAQGSFPKLSRVSLGQARINVLWLQTPKAASLLARKTSEYSFASTACRTLEATQLLDAGQSALQSRSVAIIPLISFFQQFALFFQFARPAAAGNWLAIRPRACRPPHNPPRTPPHLLSLS